MACPKGKGIYAAMNKDILQCSAVLMVAYISCMLPLRCFLLILALVLGLIGTDLPPIQPLKRFRMYKPLFFKKVGLLNLIVSWF